MHHPDSGGAFAADATLGLDGFLSRQATRLVTLAGVEHSFGRAQHIPQEFLGWQIEDEVVRRTTYAEATRAPACRTRSSPR